LKGERKNRLFSGLRRRVDTTAGESGRGKENGPMRNCSGHAGSAKVNVFCTSFQNIGAGGIPKARTKERGIGLEVKAAGYISEPRNGKSVVKGKGTEKGG
jgi:hypothetical protein